MTIMDTQENKNVRWINIVAPSEKDIAWLKKEFSLHPVIAEELGNPSVRGRVEMFKNYLFFIGYVPVYNTEDETSLRMEIDFVITKDTIVTLQYEPLKEIFHGFHLGDEVTSLDLMYRIMEHVTVFEERQLRHMRDKVESIGKELFKNREEKIFRNLTYLKRDASEYRIIVKLQEPALRALLSKGIKFWGGDAEIYLNDILGNHINIVSQLEDCREAIADFEDTNNQLLNAKVNHTMKTLTALSFLTFPFMLIAALFSMHAKDTPLVDATEGFWIITGVMAAGVIALGIYFKKKNWF